MRAITTIAFGAAVTILSSAGIHGSPLVAARTYRNPLLPDRDIADPDVIRVDGKYYLYPTSDAKGYEVFVSDDLVHWQRKARAFEDPRHGDWAPDVFHNKRGDGRFYLYYTDNSPTSAGGRTVKQIGVAVSANPL